jgi:hypothetical protein
MTTMRHLSLVRVLGPLVLGALGCGLISSDITALTFDLPPKTYSYDTAVWMLPAGNVAAIPCGGASPIADCCNPPAIPGVNIPKPDCVATPLVCEGQPTVCTVKLPITVHQQMDLKKEVPQLSSLNSQSLADITLSRIRYDVTSTMNIELPPLELYLAPDSVTDPKDPLAKKFGTVPSIPAGATIVDGDVTKEPDADQTFSARGHDFGTPFNFIATTTITIPSGSPTPSGKIDVTIKGQAKVSL